MTDFKAGDIVTTGKGTRGYVMRCNKRDIEISDEYGHLGRFTRDTFFRLCTPDEIKDYWTERRDVAVMEMTRLKLVAEDAELALYVLETGK
jgi:hypothetical protein